MTQVVEQANLTGTQPPADSNRLELLDLLLEAMADGFLDWHLDDNNIHYSSRFKLLLGYEDEPFPETPWSWLELSHPEDRPMVAKDLQDLISGAWPFDLTFRVRHRVAGWRWLRGRGAVHRNAQGDAIRLVIAFGDVTSQVRAERRQTSLINAIPDLLIRVQHDSSVVDVKIPDSCAVHAAELPSPGQKLSQVPFASSWWSQGAGALSAAIQERRPIHFEAQQRAGSDQVAACDVDIRVFPSTDEEVLFVVRDITAEKHQREQGLQSQKLEAIGQLAAGIAHEINTPLQFVGDNLHFLAEAGDALTQVLGRYRAAMPEALALELKQVEAELDIDYMIEHLKSAFAAAIDGVQRVSVIVQAMKAFSHPGQREKRPEELNHALETTITISTNVWKYVADIEREFAADLPKADCVIGEINQVFLNLITNAAHAIGDVVGDTGNKGSIRITTRRLADQVEIRISDTGRGIPENIRTRIFDPFFTTKPVGKGTGQGLPLARAIVTQHHGTLVFESELGHGTTFVVRLPIESPSTKASKSPTSR